MRMRLTQNVEQEADSRRELTVEVSVHERRGGVARPVSLPTPLPLHTPS